MVGKTGDLDLKPENYDISHITHILKSVEDLLFLNNKKDRPTITCDLQEGSVRNVFKTPVQYIIGFSAILVQINKLHSIDFLDLNTARAMESIQEFSLQTDYSFHFITSVKNEIELTISPKTKFFRVENTWVEAEFYFYGVLTNAGGKSRANIHLDTKEYGSLTIQTGKDFLRGQEENLLYKAFGIRAIGRQDLDTGAFDRKSLKRLELLDYSSQYDSDYLHSLISKAKKSWQGTDVDEWLSNIRG